MKVRESLIAIVHVCSHHHHVGIDVVLGLFDYKIGESTHDWRRASQLPDLMYCLEVKLVMLRKFSVRLGGYSFQP